MTDLFDPRPVHLRDGRVGVLRQARADDIPGLHALNAALVEDGRGLVQAPQDVQSLVDFTAQISGKLLGREPTRGVRLVADVDGTVAAESDIQRFAPTLIRHVAVLTLGVHPDFQGQGLGRATFEALLDWVEAVNQAEPGAVRRLELYTRADNHRAIALYTSCGFHEEARRASFIRTTEGEMIDDVIMARLL